MASAFSRKDVAVGEIRLSAARTLPADKPEATGFRPSLDDGPRQAYLGRYAKDAASGVAGDPLARFTRTGANRDFIP